MKYADTYCRYREIYEPNHVYVYTGPCVCTGKDYTVQVPAQGLYRYRQGAKIQVAFPDLSADDREFLMSGLSPEGYEQAWSDPPERDSEESKYLTGEEL
jgi:hypothetical protein